MRPGEFDITTCKEITGDAIMRTIEAKARSDADGADPLDPSKSFDPPKPPEGGGYWAEVRNNAHYVVYCTTFKKRLERNIRKSQNTKENYGKRAD